MMSRIAPIQNHWIIQSYNHNSLTASSIIWKSSTDHWSLITHLINFDVDPCVIVFVFNGLLMGPIPSSISLDFGKLSGRGPGWLLRAAHGIQQRGFIWIQWSVSTRRYNLYNVVFDFIDSLTLTSDLDRKFCHVYSHSSLCGLPATATNQVTFGVRCTAISSD